MKDTCDELLLWPAQTTAMKKVVFPSVTVTQQHLTFDTWMWSWMSVFSWASTEGVTSLYVTGGVNDLQFPAVRSVHCAVFCACWAVRLWYTKFILCSIF